MIAADIFVFVVLTLVNGLFAMSEMALVSARESRLKPLAERGDSRARRALELGENPNQFLSAVQIGITLIGLLAGAFSGARLSERLAAWLAAAAPGIAPAANEIAFAAVIAVLTFLTLVFGEIVPKRIAIARPEPIALAVAGLISAVARVTAPFVALLSATSNAVLAALRLRETGDSEVTEDEVKHVLAEGVEAGVLEPEEREMLEGVMRVADRPVRAIMTPRPDLYWIDPNDPPDAIRREIAECPYSLMVVADGTIDEAVGVLYKKDLLAAALAGEAFDVRAHVKQPVVVPDTAPVLKLFELFRATPVHSAFVVDEYGSLQGLITLTDIIEGIAGDLPDVDDERVGPVQREDGSWLIDGDTDLDDLERILGLSDLPRGGYHTLGGLLISVMNRIPGAGDWAEVAGFRFEVVDMDGRRVDKVLVSSGETGRGLDPSG